MKKRLYFLLPEPDQARCIVEELQQNGIKQRHIHAMDRSGTLEGLPQATANQRSDLLHRAERWLWNGNLVLFFVAFAALLYGVANSQATLLIFSLAVMVTTVVAGAVWSQQPDASLDEVKGGLAHGEVLLMVDVAPKRTAEIEDLIHRRHPEAAVGGVSWAVDAWGL